MIKKILPIFILAVAGGFFVFPVFAQGQTTTAGPDAAVPQTCWPQQMCQKAGGQWYRDTKNPPKECDVYKAEQLGYCYAPAPKVNLEVAIGEKNTIAGLTDYIPSAYNYLLGIVSIVAIIMIMIGGLKYLTAGGSPEKISSAKEAITGAIVGLFLVLGSYLLLQTINPALVSLKMPDIKMIRTQALEGEKSACPSDSPQATGKIVYSNCKTSCYCPTKWECLPVEGSAGQIISKSKLTVWSATAITGGAVVAGTPIVGMAKTAGKYIIKGTYDALKTLVPLLAGHVLKNPVEGAIAYMMVDSLTSDSQKTVDNGVCVQWANHTLPGGSLCASTDNCIQGLKCIDPSTKEELTGKKIGDIGSCVGNPKVFTGELQCTANSDCVAQAGTSTDLACVGGYCSWGDEGNTCCGTATIDGTSINCDKGENTCKGNLTCGILYGSNLTRIDANYSSASAPSGLLNAIRQAHQTSSGRCFSNNDSRWP